MLTAAGSHFSTNDVCISKMKKAGHI